MSIKTKDGRKRRRRNKIKPKCSQMEKRLNKTHSHANESTAHKYITHILYCLNGSNDRMNGWLCVHLKCFFSQATYMHTAYHIAKIIFYTGSQCQDVRNRKSVTYFWYVFISVVSSIHQFSPSPILLPVFFQRNFFFSSFASIKCFRMFH